MGGKGEVGKGERGKGEAFHPGIGYASYLLNTKLTKIKEDSTSLRSLF